MKKLGRTSLLFAGTFAAQLLPAQSGLPAPSPKGAAPSSQAQEETLRDVAGFLARGDAAWAQCNPLRPTVALECAQVYELRGMELSLLSLRVDELPPKDRTRFTDGLLAEALHEMTTGLRKATLMGRIEKLAEAGAPKYDGVTMASLVDATGEFAADIGQEDVSVEYLPKTDRFEIQGEHSLKGRGTQLQRRLNEFVSEKWEMKVSSVTSDGKIVVILSPRTTPLRLKQAPGQRA